MGTYWGVSATGDLTLGSTGRVRKTILLPPQMWKIHYWDVAESWNGGSPGSIYVFPSGGYNTLCCQFIIPGDYDSGLRVRVWGFTNTGANQVYFTLGAMRTGEGGIWTTIGGDDIASNLTFSFSNGQLHATSWWEMHSSFVTPPAVHDILGLKLNRNDNDANDTYAGAWYWVGLEVEYISKKLGEATT